jgi:hypothetical protein
MLKNEGMVKKMDTGLRRYDKRKIATARKALLAMTKEFTIPYPHSLRCVMLKSPSIPL